MDQRFVTQDTQDVSRMLSALDSAQNSKRGAFSVKKSTFHVKSSQAGIKVDSWKMQEWDYKRGDLPTYARGLFTTKTKRNNPEIAIRGYDKFFNIDEVPETKWESIIAKTSPPYEITLKENGCIIFVSGLEDDTLLVCSKHSTGDRADVQVSHASAGERQLERQLITLGKTKAEFARELRRRNVTAVAELCDDNFEEHVLAYGPEKAGLYLHGVNLNLPGFTTYPSADVQAFADAWGFRKTGLIIFNDIRETREFLERAAETGTHDEQDVEGFVIRCKRSAEPSTQPYQDWFFKFKFEEPYLMYRQWRECTKALIAGKMPKFKKHMRITEEYLLYVRKRLAADPKLAKQYTQNHGIIALRDDFLRFRDINGHDAAGLDESDPIVKGNVMKDVILCPVATIGCGKTTVALALTHLFGWGHVQNDNITGKGRPPRFTKAVLGQLETYPVVFADRNNATKSERRQIVTDVKIQHTNAHLVCLNFRHDQESMETLKKVTRDRVLARGDNHQTIHAATERAKYLGVMEGFLNRFEHCTPYAPPDNGFDAIIDLDPIADSRSNVETIVTQLKKHFPCLIDHLPSATQYDSAIKAAIGYQPDKKHLIPDRTANSKKKPRLEYMSIDASADDIRRILEKAFEDASPQTRHLYTHLKQSRRVQSQFHVTLLHRAVANMHPELWRRYTALWEAAGSSDEKLGSCDLMLERIVFDDRIMAIVVRLAGEQGAWECANRVAHITVGTRDDSVKPKESNDLLERWLEIGADTENIGQVVLDRKPVIGGTVRGVRSR